VVQLTMVFMLAGVPLLRLLLPPALVQSRSLVLIVAALLMAFLLREQLLHRLLQLRVQ